MVRVRVRANPNTNLNSRVRVRVNPNPTRPQQDHVMIWEWIEYFFWILWLQKPYTRHQNYISTIYNSREKWTCMICRPSWTPSGISQNCQGLRGDTIIFLETGDLLKRLTPLTYFVSFRSPRDKFFKHLLLHYCFDLSKQINRWRSNDKRQFINLNNIVMIGFFLFNVHAALRCQMLRTANITSMYVSHTIRSEKGYWSAQNRWSFGILGQPVLLTLKLHIVLIFRRKHMKSSEKN